MNTLAIELEPLALGARCTDDELIVQLSDGRTLSVPLVWFPRLSAAKSDARNDIRLVGRGEGLHWPAIDEDVSVPALLDGRPSYLHRKQP